MLTLEGLGGVRAAAVVTAKYFDVFDAEGVVAVFEIGAQRKRAT